MFVGYIKNMKDVLKVQADSSHDVLVRRQSVIDVVGVVDDVSAKQQASASSEYEVHSLSEGDEYSNKTSHH